MEVSPDRLVIDFELLTERSTFAEAAEGARQIATGLEGISLPADGVSLSVDYDLTFMRQKSWGRGRKLEHRFRMTVDNIPDGKTQEIMVHLVDGSLGLDSKLTVEHFDALLSEDHARAISNQLLEQAVADARATAAVLASAAGLRIVSPTSISVGGPGLLMMSSTAYHGDDSWPVGANFSARRQEAFVVNANLPSRIRQSVRVSARFSVEQM